MSVIVSTALRRLVAQRAGHRCEYCLFPEAVALHRHEPDHIVPLLRLNDTDRIVERRRLVEAGLFW